MTNETDEPPSMGALPQKNGNALSGKPHSASENSFLSGTLSQIKRLIIKPKADTSLRETIEEYIEEEAPPENGESSVSTHEKTLISNVLDLRDMTASDVMIPRADIVSISDKTPIEELLALLAERQHSRLPVYRETLDNVIGSIHVKDILSTLARGEKLNILDLVRDVPIVSPSMPILDLLLQMRLTRKHMALVIDEYGGVDGLITIGDVIESIVGEIDDEHDPEDQVEITQAPDGSIQADARVALEEFEEQFGYKFSEEEHEENDTLGGLVSSIAGRVPARGEVLTHKEGMIFEILDADPRRVNRLRIRTAP